MSRANSTDETLLAALLGTPIFNADTAQRIAGTTDASTYRALGRLTDAGILEVLSESNRNRVWAATEVLAELDALSTTIGKRTTEHLAPRPGSSHSMPRAATRSVRVCCGWPRLPSSLTSRTNPKHAVSHRLSTQRSDGLVRENLHGMDLLWT